MQQDQVDLHKDSYVQAHPPPPPSPASGGGRRPSSPPVLIPFAEIRLPTIDATPVADAERHNLDRAQIIIDGNVLIVGMHDRGRARSEDHRWGVGIAVEKPRIRRALAAAD